MYVRFSRTGRARRGALMLFLMLPLAGLRGAPKPGPRASLPSTGLPASHIYVLTTINGTKVTRFDLSGHAEGPPLLLGGCACASIALDKQGRVYVSNNGPRNNVMVFTPDGQRTAPTLNLAIGGQAVAIEDDGTIDVLGSRNYETIIKSFTQAGSAVVRTIKTGVPVPGVAMAHSADGKFYVAFGAKPAVAMYDAAGKTTGPPLRAGLRAANAVALAPDGSRIYVSNFVSVATFLPSGERTQPTITFAIKGTDGFYQPGPLAVDASGRIFVGFYSLGGGVGGIAVYDPAGTLLTKFFVPAGVTSIAVN